MKKFDSSLPPVLVLTELGKKSPLRPWPSKSCDSGGIEGFTMRLPLRQPISRVAHAEPPTTRVRATTAENRNTSDRDRPYPDSRQTIPAALAKMWLYSNGVSGRVAPVKVSDTPRTAPVAIRIHPAFADNDNDRNARTDKTRTR